MRWLLLFVPVGGGAAAVVSSDAFHANQQQKSSGSSSSVSRFMDDEGIRRNLVYSSLLDDLEGCAFWNSYDCYYDCQPGLFSDTPLLQDFGIGSVEEGELYCEAIDLEALPSCCSVCTPIWHDLVTHLASSAWYTKACSWWIDPSTLSIPEDTLYPWRRRHVCDNSIRLLLQTDTFDAESAGTLTDALQCVDSFFRAIVVYSYENSDGDPRSTDDDNIPYVAVVVVACGSTAILIVVIGVLRAMFCRPKTTEEPDDETVATNEEEEAAAAAARETFVDDNHGDETLTNQP